MVNPRTLLGAQELTVMLSGYLVGILTVQTYYYLRNSTGDPWVLKALVCFLWLTEFTCIVCMYHGFYIISILTPGPPKEVLSPTLTIAPLFLSSLNAPLTQAYFTYRLYRFSQKKWLAILLWMSSAILVVVVLLASTSMVLSSDREVWRQNWNGAYVSSMVLVAALDVIIAGCLCYYLYKSGRDQGTPTFRRTVKLVDGVILWTIQTGLLTSIVAVTAMTIFFADYNNCAWLVLNLVVTRLYPNTLVATMIARERFRRIIHDGLALKDNKTMPSFVRQEASGIDPITPLGEHRTSTASTASSSAV
ncbi:hypothetical protein HGRIS_001808 [Hohenbuehelia grisea]|uniref:DUF6534 domain-containing protein n=1 Tax=Hohenbuehelia grisea TaxID=104357 RepID=A0ABR3JJ80_9AGAR